MRLVSRKDRAPREPRISSSPRAAGMIGILFAVLFTIAVAILYLAMRDTETSATGWLQGRTGLVRFAVGLMPFAGICFLWFIGVVRSRLGRFEDQFFSTVFLGSGLIFLAMIFVATGAAAGVVAGYARDPGGFAGSTTDRLARDLTTQIFGVYALRMAAVFLMSQASLWSRTRVMPRWLVVITYAVSLLLLVVYSHSFWVVFVFPGWVFLVSAYVLIVSLVERGSTGIPEPAEAAGATDE